MNAANFFNIIEALVKLDKAFKEANLDNHIALQITPHAWNEIRSFNHAPHYINRSVYEDHIVGVPIVLRDNSSD